MPFVPWTHVFPLAATAFSPLENWMSKFGTGGGEPHKVQTRRESYLLIYRFYLQRIYSTRYTKHEENKNRDCPLRRADAAPPATIPGYVGGRQHSRDPPREPGHTSFFTQSQSRSLSGKKPTVKPQEKPGRYDQIVF